MKKKNVFGKLCLLATTLAGFTFLVKNREEILFHLANAE